MVVANCELSASGYAFVAGPGFESRTLHHCLLLSSGTPLDYVAKTSAGLKPIVGRASRRRLVDLCGLSDVFGPLDAVNVRSNLTLKSGSI